MFNGVDGLHVIEATLRFGPRDYTRSKLRVNIDNAEPLALPVSECLISAFARVPEVLAVRLVWSLGDDPGLNYPNIPTAQTPHLRSAAEEETEFMVLPPRIIYSCANEM